MEWTLRLVGTEIEGQSRSCEVMAISRPDGLGDIAALGLTLAEAKLLLGQVQQEVVAAQARQHTLFRPDCQSCSGRCHVKGWRPHRIATLFGEVRVKLPRLACAGAGCSGTDGGWPSHCRSTPELDQLQARLSALMPYRVAADVLPHLLPIDAGKSPETLRSHTLKVGKRLGDAAAEKPPAAATAITISLDSTFIRSREDGERHLEVRVGNVETVDGGRQVFGAVARAETDVAALIQRTLETVGRTDTTEVTAFTDGCSGLRAVLVNAGVTKPPILDWFHIAMRLQHTKLAAANLSTDSPRRRLPPRSDVCTGAFGTARRGMPSAASSGSARSCMSSRASTARAQRACRRASCGTRCMRSISISVAKPHGWSTMPNGTVPVNGSERRSPKARRTSW
jgi:hypothetical protein